MSKNTGKTVKIALCYVQSINSPIATCVNFGLQNPQISQNPRQAEKCHFAIKNISTMTKTMVQISLNSDKRFSCQLKAILSQSIHRGTTSMMHIVLFIHPKVGTCIAN